jgi:5-formyltetrahydrofolate cyclo-ligase
VVQRASRWRWPTFRSPVPNPSVLVLEPNVGADKAEQRRVARDARKSLTPEYRIKASDKICTHILSSRAFAAATVVASYEWVHSEVQTSVLNLAILAAGKQLIVPEVTGPESMRFVDFHDRSLVVDLAVAELILVPAVGFDLDGNRMGNGRGYYDRSLSAINSRTVCLVFDAQRLDSLIVEPTDVVMDVVITESGVIVGGERWE